MNEVVTPTARRDTFVVAVAAGASTTTRRLLRFLRDSSSSLPSIAVCRRCGPRARDHAIVVDTPLSAVRGVIGP
ncbi:MAG TPA: hypothetical protein VGF99_07680 [Myxococcota bacterium]